MAFNQAGFLTLPAQPATPPISNGRIGMMLLVGTETILFSSFIGAYLVLRLGAPAWPPAATPILKIGLSAVNTGVLILSSLFAIGSRSAIRRNHIVRTKSLLTATLATGTLFLILQGVEFHQLYARGLTLQTGPYGAVFFSLVSCHGLHVMGGLVFLAVVLSQAMNAKEDGIGILRERIGLSEIYWHFVTAIWLVLFTILYIL